MSWFGEDDKVRKNDWPIWDFMFGYFARAWLEVVRVAVVGNKQHNPGQRLHWAREKSTDQLNTAMRHLFDYAKAKAEGQIVPRDAKGMAVLAQSIWRLSAQLQLDLEAEEKAGPKAGIRDTSQPLPADVIQKTCKCGARVYAYRKGDLSPQVMDPTGSLHRIDEPCLLVEKDVPRV
jgi:hypothetical protein